MNWLLKSNSTGARLLRTIIEAVIGVLVANVDVLTSNLSFSPEIKSLIVALVVAIMSPILATLSEKE